MAAFGACLIFSEAIKDLPVQLVGAGLPGAVAECKASAAAW
jgi:hypothetical protein